MNIEWWGECGNNNNILKKLKERKREKRHHLYNMRHEWMSGFFCFCTWSIKLQREREGERERKRESARAQKATPPPPLLSSKWSKGSPARSIWPAGLITSPGCDPLFLWWHGKFLVHAVGKVPLTETTGRAAVCQTYSGSRATPHFPLILPAGLPLFQQFSLPAFSELRDIGSGVLDG